MAHKHFKVTIATIKNGQFDEVSKNELKAFLNQGYSLKSLGVEYIESLGKAVVSIGYSPETSPLHYDLVIEPAGMLDIHHPEILEKALETAAAKWDDIICHEFFVTEQGAVYATFLRESGR